RKNLCQLTVLNPHKIENQQPQEAEKEPHPRTKKTHHGGSALANFQSVDPLGLECPQCPWGLWVRQNTHPDAALL
ncbi:unnamed protein product, partial [Gulo gulo]